MAIEYVSRRQDSPVGPESMPVLGVISRMNEFINKLQEETLCLTAEKVVEAGYHEDDPVVLTGRHKFILVSDLEFTGLFHKMQNLVDANSLLFRWSLADDGVDLEAYVSALATSLACPPEKLWIFEEAVEFVRETNLSTMIVLLSEAHLLGVGFLDSLLRLTGKLCPRVCWVLDDISVLTRFRLPLQMAFKVGDIKSRSADEWAVEVVGELLSCELLPSLDLCNAMLSTLKGDRLSGSQQVKRLLRTALLEHSMKSWSAESYSSTPSFKREWMASGKVDVNNPQEIQEYGDGLLCDARMWTRRWAAAWRVLALLRGAYADCFPINPGDLIKSLPVLKSYLAGWLKDLVTCPAFTNLDAESLSRKVNILHRELQKQPPCPSIKDLLRRLDSVEGRRDLKAVSEWIECTLTVNLDSVVLHEALILTSGPASRKLINPRCLETLQLALEHPQFYGQRGAPGPDGSIVYRLASECGKFINTCDWYISFRQSVDPERKHQNETELIVRFLRAVNELQLFGLVAPTKKRRDHYERLVVFHR